MCSVYIGTRRLSELIVVAHVNAQAECRRFLGVSRHKLFLGVIQIRIERILWVHVDEDHVGEWMLPQEAERWRRFSGLVDNLL